MSYKIAIPSYKRVNILQKKTLNLLKKYNIKPKKIYIFVANEEEYKNYKEELKKDKLNNKYKIIIGKVGIKNIRNFMAKYFKENEKIFYIDDDISYIYEVYNNINSDDRKYNKLKELDNLDLLIKNNFKICKKKNISNWGIYPVENPYFMKLENNLDNHISTNLRYIMGGFTGVINNHKSEIRTVDDKEDYERSIKYYLKDNGILRFNNICCRTSCYKEPGGMQILRTKEKIHKSALKLVNKYPKLCSLNTTKKSGITEIRLRDKR